MKKLMSLGCLMALIFAGASAFAADWFTTVAFPATGATPVSGDVWTAIPESWVLTSGVGSFKDWVHPLTYQAAQAVEVANDDATVITELKFTAIDGSELDQNGVPVDLADVPVDGAKAGLTVVEAANASLSYWGLYGGTWVQLTGATPDLTKNVTVKIALCKYGDGAIVKYSVDDYLLGPVSSQVSTAAPTDASFQSISYLGNCPAIASLAGQKFSNAPAAKESIDTGVTGDSKIPETIQVSRTDLLERGIDPDNATAVTTYLTTKKEIAEGGNGQYGWVNVTLGIGDDQIVGIESNVCATGSITLDYGFVKGTDGTIEYVIDGAAGAADATINTAESGIHSVKVVVKKGGAEVEVVTESVGVMNTGKTLTKEEKEAKGTEKIFDIVAVPFAAFQGYVTVANVLNTAELHEGDTLYILNGGKYDTFVLNASLKWEAVGETSYSRTQQEVTGAKTPEEYNLTPGTAIWIERDVDSKIVFAGKGETTEEHKWIWDEENKPVYSLVANPTVNPIKIGAATFGNNGDMIIIEDVNNPKQYEKVDGTWGEWVTTTKTVRGKTVSSLTFVSSSDCVIPAGIGFWYYNATKQSVTINFGTNAKPTPAVVE